MIRKIIIPLILIALLTQHEYSQSDIEAGIIPVFPLLYGCLLVVLCVITIMQLIKGIKKYITTPELFVLAPAIICLAGLLLVLGHRYYRFYNDNSPALVTVIGSHKGSNAEIRLHFKKNGYLKAHASYKFSDEYYWGDFDRQGDTLVLHIDATPELAKKAYFKGNDFHFINDSSRFAVVDTRYDPLD